MSGVIGQAGVPVVAVVALACKSGNSPADDFQKDVLTYRTYLEHEHAMSPLVVLNVQVHQ